MTTITFRAIYRDGVIEPQVKLDLPEHALVEVQITPLSAGEISTATLFGAFPELATLTGDDFAWAKRLWEHGAENQSQLLDGLAPV